MNKHQTMFGFTPHVLSSFTALRPNLLAPADGEGGSETLIGGGDWNTQGFIGEDDQEALGIHDPLREGPQIFGMPPIDGEGDDGDGDKGADDADDADGADEADDADDANADDADADGADDADDDDDDDDDDANADDDKEDENDADDDEEDAATAKKVRGLQREVVRQRARAREAEENLRDITAKLQAARKKEAEELPALKTEMRGHIVALNKARINEDVEAMTDAEEAIEELRRKIARIDGASERLADSKERAAKAVSGVVLELANTAVAEYPILDEKSKSFDPDVVTMINALYTENAAKMNAADAFGDAVERVMKKLGQKPKSGAAPREKAKQNADKQAAVSRRQKAAKSTPRANGKGDRSLGGDYVYNSADFESKKGRAKLEKQLGIVLPR